MVVVIQAGVYSTDDQWVFVDRTKDLPEEAVLGGYDPEGYYNYVGRVSYVSNVLPARVVPELDYLIIQVTPPKIIYNRSYQA